MSCVRAVLDRDPAARNAFEVIMCYPSVHAIFWHRLSHRLWRWRMKLPARVLSQWVRFFTGIEIHPGAKIGKGLFIDHGIGVVIGETAEIGDNVTIYQDVTLGGTGKITGKRHPTIKNNVVIGAGAKVLGPFTVGCGAKIGAGAIVLKEVPPDTTVVGNPGKVVRRNGAKVGDVIDLDQIHMPDPIAQRLEEMSKRIEQLEQIISETKFQKREETKDDTPL